MARRLHDRGYPVTAVADTVPERAAALAAEIGAIRPRTLAAVTAASQIVLTVVSDDQAMRDIFGPSQDSLLVGAVGKVFINCATVSPDIHHEVEALARQAGASTLEACMASSITQAREGTLYFMCGGDRAVFDAVRPVLDDLATQVRYVGATGQAAQVKALVNMVMNIHTAALAEGLGLADALGLDLSMVREILAQTGAASRVLETDGADMQHRDHACFFSAAHAAKDSEIALALARRAGLSLPLAEATLRQFNELVTRGLGEMDKSAVAELTFLGRGNSPS